MTIAVGLARVPLSTLEELRDAILRNRIVTPLREADLQAIGFGALARSIAVALQGVGHNEALTAVALVIAERVHRPPPHLRLVWTGPEATASVSRDTSLVVGEMFRSATRTVIVGGYAFDSADILEPLHRAMRDRAVSAHLFLDIPGEEARGADADAFATAFVDRFFRNVWTFGMPKPDVYYDPRTAVAGPPWASLHAKCIVVDDERTLLTSANFTDRGQTRNIEAGVIIEDRAFAEELAAQWRQLVSAGLVHRYRG